MFIWIAASVADTFVVNPNGMSNFLANDASKFLVNGKPTFIDAPRNLIKNPPDCITLALFPSRTIARDLCYHESPTCHE